jgi:hypothetical protein
MADDAEARDEPDDTPDEISDAGSVEPSRKVAPASAARGWAMALGVTLISGAAVSYAFMPAQAGESRMFIALGAVYGALLAATVWWMLRRDQLRRLLPRRGDISVGALCAVAIYGLLTVLDTTLTGHGSPREVWIIRVYLQLGDPRLVATFIVGIGVLALAAVEEVVWRGWVLGALAEVTSPRRAWLASSALYALAHAPTIYLLRDPAAGPNPAVFALALGAGLLWGYLALRLERLGPSVFAHALLSWAVIEFPLWRM